LSSLELLEKGVEALECFRHNRNSNEPVE
jgi:hypothetical protein